LAIPAFVLLALITGAGYAYSTGLLQTTLSPPFLFNYVVTIIMENHGLNDTYGSHCLGNCTYITQLSNQYGLALRYSSVAHTSLPNYLTLTSGGNYDRVPFNRDCYPENLTTGCYISGLNIVDSIESSRLSWKAYMEDHTSGGCARSNNPVTYENSHNPFLYYTDIYNNATRCAKIVDANPGANGFLALPTQLISDLSSTASASNYMWLTPNLCNDGHNLCPPLNNTVSQSNLYLSMLVPKILNSTIFKTKNAALFITWDESSTTANNIVTAIWAGPAAKTNYRSTASYTQYSGIKTIEIAWSLPSLYPEDANAAAMSEFFISTQSGTSPGGGRRATPM
jgi:hypothetical protein